MQCGWPPSVSQQPQPPWGFYTEWHCRIKYSLYPASASVSGCETSWSRQHCPFPSGLFHTRAPDNYKKRRIQQQREETAPAQKSSRLLISLHSADRNRAICGIKAGYDGGWDWWSDCNYCDVHPTQKASFAWYEVKSWLTCLSSGFGGRGDCKSSKQVFKEEEGWVDFCISAKCYEMQHKHACQPKVKLAILLMQKTCQKNRKLLSFCKAPWQDSWAS